MSEMAKLKKAKRLIEKDRINAGKSKSVRYSAPTKESILSLTKTISNRSLCQELGVSLSFIEKLKRNSLSSSTSKESDTPLQLFDVTNSFMQEAPAKVLPIMKFTTARGLTIEIFE